MNDGVHNEMCAGLNDVDNSDVHSMDYRNLSVDIVEKLKNLLQRNFGIESSIIQRINQNTVNVKITARGIVAEVFYMFCDAGKKSKKFTLKMTRKEQNTGYF